MRWADIEVPNRAADVNSQARSACYPQSTFYPMSDGPSMWDHRITKTCFRTCSTCRSRSQATLCLCTLRLVSNQPEVTFVRLRYNLGGDRPSQTARQTVSRSLFQGVGEKSRASRVVFHRWLCRDRDPGFTASHLFYAEYSESHCQVTVKVHGVFPSCCG